MQYQNAIITFIDILGFKGIVENSSGPASIKNMLTDFAYSAKLDDDAVSDHRFKPKAYQFSDSIVRIRPINKFRDGIVFMELLDLIFIQVELAQKGVLIRGGVTLGDIYFDKTDVFGTGLNCAYELESKFAIYPRVIIDSKLLQEFESNPNLRSDTNDLNEEKEFIEKLVCQDDKDGLWFVDYLHGIYENLDYPCEYSLFLNRHKELIERKLNNFKSCDRITEKYTWLADYHKSCVSRKYEIGSTEYKKLLVNL